MGWKDQLPHQGPSPEKAPRSAKARQKRHTTPETSNLARLCRSRLECAVILRHLRVNDPVSASVYKRAMMNNRILTLLATAAAIAAGTSLAQAQSYPPASGAYATAAPGEYRRQLPDFDNVDDEE